MKSSLRLAFVILSLTFGACSSGNQQPDGSIPQDGMELTDDQSMLDDGPFDAGQDGAEDSPLDAGVDAGEDAASDATNGEEQIQDGGDQEGDSQTQGACNNQKDLDILAALSPEEMSNASRNCSMQCLSNQDKSTCIAECFSKSTGLSYDCSLCFADVSICIMEKCLSQCMADPNSPACQDCRTNNCMPAFEQCSGIKEP